jgi:hypothetical protein
MWFSITEMGKACSENNRFQFTGELALPQKPPAGKVLQIAAPGLPRFQGIRNSTHPVEDRSHNL